MTANRSVAIIGLGFVGIPLACLFSKKGYRVIGIDIDPNKTELLRQKQSYLSDIEDQEIAEIVDSGLFTVTSDFRAVEGVNCIIICVPTPLLNREPDLSYIKSAAKSIAPHLQPQQLIVLESSTYPGTTEEFVKPLVENNLLKVGENLFLGYSPERIDPGNKNISIENIPKVVSGVTEECLKRVEQLYRSVFKQIVPVSSPSVAEFTKMLENSQRLINISFINEVNFLAKKLNINLWEVIEAARTKPMGFTAYFPSAGIGGHCIPVDPFFLSWIGMREGVPLTMIHSAGLINESIPHFIVSQVVLQLSKLQVQFESAKVGVIGLTYKKDVNDIRESAALKVIELMVNKQMIVSVYDPVYPGVLPLGVERFVLAPDSLKKFDVTLILVDHSNILWDFVIQHSNCVIDTRNVTSHSEAKHIIRI